MIVQLAFEADINTDEFPTPQDLADKITDELSWWVGVNSITTLRAEQTGD
jgi:hypothetical protein